MRTDLKINTEVNFKFKIESKWFIHMRIGATITATLTALAVVSRLKKFSKNKDMLLVI